MLDSEALIQLRGLLEREDGPQLVADGYFGTFAGKGHWSYRSPEGLDDLIDCRIADFDVVSDFDVRAGADIVEMECGEFAVPSSTTYAILEPRGDTRPIATIGDRVVGVQSADGRFTWYGFSLSATASTNVTGQPASPAPVGAVHDDVALSMLQGAGVEPWFGIAGDRVVAFRRASKQGGSLVFLISVEDRTAKTTVKPRWAITSARDLLEGSELSLSEGAFQLEMSFGEVRVIHCANEIDAT